MNDYFSEGEEILYGKWKNKRGKIIRLFRDEKGNPAIEVEPIPKGRKKNKIMTLFRVWKLPDARGLVTARIVTSYVSRLGLDLDTEEGLRLESWQVDKGR